MPASQRNPFDFIPQEPDFFSPFPSAQRREFPPLFPVRNPEPPPQAAAPASSGSFGDLIGMFLSPGSRSGTGGMNLVGMLSNVQKAIQTAQTVLPMIQQFGPLIRNAPAILSALKSVPDTNSKADPVDSEKAEAASPPAEKKAAEDEKAGEPEEKNKSSEEPEKADTKTARPAPAKNVHPKKSSLKNTDDLVTRPSRPKLYI